VAEHTAIDTDVMKEWPDPDTPGEMRRGYASDAMMGSGGDG